MAGCKTIGNQTSLPKQFLIIVRAKAIYSVYRKSSHLKHLFAVILQSRKNRAFLMKNVAPVFRLRIFSS